MASIEGREPERRERVLGISAHNPAVKAPFSERHPLIAGFGRAAVSTLVLFGASCALPADMLPRPSSPVAPVTAAPPAPVEVYDYARFRQIADRIDALVPQSYHINDPRIFDTGRFPDTAGEVHGLYQEINAHFADIDALLASGTLTAEQVRLLNNMKTIISSALSALSRQQIAAGPSSLAIVCNIVPTTGYYGDGSSPVLVICPQPSHTPESLPDLMLGLPASAPARVPTGVPIANSDGKGELTFEMGLQGNPLDISPGSGTYDAPLTIGPVLRF